jgi:outer membrane receptor protein involved in Fe transport
MSTNHRLATAVALALTPLLVCQAARAADAPAEANRAAPGLEEIIVTAQKRSERLIDVPIAIAAFGDQALADTGAAQLSDFLQTAPGVGIVDNQNGTQNIQIRGINSVYGNAPIGYYLDELPFSLIGNTQVPDVRTYDLQRVEVLRGPQGTLYGDGSLGGTIRILTNDPDLQELGGSVSLTGMDTTDGGGSTVAQGMVNVPLSKDVAALRLVAGYEDYGGWVDNAATGEHDENDRRIDTYRGKFRWAPSERLDMVFSAWHNESDGTGSTLATKDYETAFPPDESKVDYDLYSATVRYAFDTVDLVSATSYMDYSHELLTYVAGLFAFTDETDEDVFSQELRLTSKSDGPFRWTGGLFYRAMDRGTFSALPDFFFTQDLNMQSDAWAVFGEGTLSLLDKRLDLTVGLRYFEDQLDYSEVIDPALLSLIQSVDPSYDGKVNETFDALSPKFNVAYKLADDWMVYGNVAKGFRTGQAQPAISLGLAILSGVQVPSGIDPETLWSYEVGTKGAFADGRVRVEAAVYYNDWQDLQVPVAVTSQVRALVNGGSARTQGFELGLTFMPMDGLTLELNGGYTDAKFAEDVAGINIHDGDEIPGVPETTASAAATYRWTLRNGLGGFAHAGVQYASERTDTVNLALPSDDTTQLDLRFGLEGKSLAGYVFVDNATDEDGAYDVYNFGPTGPAPRVRPRTYGAELRYSF